MAQGVCELLWFKSLLNSLGFKQEWSMPLHYDNTAAVEIAHNLVQHDQTKHIEIDTLHQGKARCSHNLLFFLPVAVFSLFSGETAHRRLHHTGSPSPRERGRKKKREEEEEERGRKKKRREEEEEAERKGEEERKEEEEEEGRRRSRERRKKKQKQSCEKVSPEEEIGFVGEERGRTEEVLKKKTRVTVRLVGRTGHVVRLSHVRFSLETKQSPTSSSRLEQESRRRSSPRHMSTHVSASQCTPPPKATFKAPPAQPLILPGLHTLNPSPARLPCQL
ncbi:hypothetical protein ACLB2K_016229 [Fragaria x ananassa]